MKTSTLLLLLFPFYLLSYPVTENVISILNLHINERLFLADKETDYSFIERLNIKCSHKINPNHYQKAVGTYSSPLTENMIKWIAINLTTGGEALIITPIYKKKDTAAHLLERHKCERLRQERIVKIHFFESKQELLDWINHKTNDKQIRDYLLKTVTTTSTGYRVYEEFLVLHFKKSSE